MFLAHQIMGFLWSSMWLLWTSTLVFTGSEAAVCKEEMDIPVEADELIKYNQSMKMSSVQLVGKEFVCPGDEYPYDYVECCSPNDFSSPGKVCCPRKAKESHISDKVVIVITVIVVVAASVGTIVIIICCFSSQCPLYNSCRVTYSSDISFGTEAGPNTVRLGSENDIHMKAMPPDNSGKKVFFWPQLTLKKGKEKGDNV